MPPRSVSAILSDSAERPAHDEIDEQQIQAVRHLVFGDDVAHRLRAARRQHVFRPRP